MVEVAVVGLDHLRAAMKSMEDHGLAAVRATAAIESFSHAASISFNIERPSPAFRRLFWRTARAECLRFQAKHKGRPGWKGIPRRLGMPGYPRFKIAFTPTGES
jgi:hypothetical protein